MSEIRSARLLLVRPTIGKLSALMSGPDEYERVFGHQVVDGYIEYPDMLPFSIGQTRLHENEHPWWLPFLLIHQQDNTLIGICGYKGAPDDAGFVEIGYGIAPSYQGKGLGTEVVLELPAA